jgi:hypothetical protein
MTITTFGSLLEQIDCLSDERQDELLEILRHRRAERRREEIAGNARQARQLHAQGKLPRGSVDDLMRSLGDEAA